MEMVIAPIAAHIPTVQSLLTNKHVKIAAQDMSSTGTGAFTGEMSGEQLMDLGVDYVILGHSERRKHFGESNESVASKIAKAQEIGLKAIVCIGEQLADREAEKTNEVIFTQLESIKKAIKDWSKIVIAYEPVWAIGTGKNAEPEDAEDTMFRIRQWIAENVNDAVADKLQI